MMRILQIDKFYDITSPESGGVGTNIAILTEHLEQRGHRVLRFGARRGASPHAMPEFVDYTALKSTADKVLGAARIIDNPLASRALSRFLSEHRIDIAHVHNLYHHLTPSVLVTLKRKGIPVVMSVRDFRQQCPVKHFLRDDEVCTECYPHQYVNCVRHRCGGDIPSSLAITVETLMQRFFRRYIQNVERFLCPSRFLADVLLGDGYPASKVQVLRNPSQPLDSDDSNPAQNGVLYVGRLSPEKGVDLLLHAARAFPETPVIIVGDGPAREELQRIARRDQIDNVTFTGHLQRVELGAYYKSASVVVLPSRCFENSPNTVIEALMQRRCVIAPDHGPIPEWIDDRRTGRTFQAGSAEDLQRVLGEVLDDPQSRTRMGCEGEKLVRKRHDRDRIIAQLLDVYREVLS